MLIFQILWLIINLSLIIFILIRNPDQQTLQEFLASLQIFDTVKESEIFFDRVIYVLILIYFLFALFIGAPRFFNIYN